MLIRTPAVEQTLIKPQTAGIGAGSERRLTIEEAPR
jgi:hypothetical protein